MLEHFQVPAHFIEQRNDHAMNHAFCSLVVASVDSSVRNVISWAHLICKDVSLNSAGVTICHSANFIGDPHWHHFSFVLVEEFSLGLTSSKANNITLIAFDPHSLITQHFHKRLKQLDMECVLADPYYIFADILPVIWQVMDNVAWNLKDTFRVIEQDILRRALQEISNKRLDFAHLHVIGKDSIHLIEGFEASQRLLTSLCEESARRYQSRTGGSTLTSKTELQFQDSLRLFRSTALSLSSIKDRIANITNLSFNLVAQEDSRIMRADSNAMKTIAVVTLVFLPSTLVASVFGSAFFSFNHDTSATTTNTSTIEVSPFFWIFWVVTIPLTLFVLLGWWLMTSEWKWSASGQVRNAFKILA